LIFFLVINGKESQSYNNNHSPLDSDSMSRISQADSGLITSSSWNSRPRRNSPPNNSYRHSAASSIDSGRSSTALYDSPKVIQTKNLSIRYIQFLYFRLLLYQVLSVMLVLFVAANRNHLILIKQVIEVQIVV
jgi:hypothetical protein